METKEVIINGKKETIVVKMDDAEREEPFFYYDNDEDTIELTPEMIKELNDKMSDDNG